MENPLLQAVELKYLYYHKAVLMYDTFNKRHKILSQNKLEL